MLYLLDAALEIPREGQNKVPIGMGRPAVLSGTDYGQFIYLPSEWQHTN